MAGRTSEGTQTAGKSSVILVALALTSFLFAADLAGPFEDGFRRLALIVLVGGFAWTAARYGRLNRQSTIGLTLLPVVLLIGLAQTDVHETGGLLTLLLVAMIAYGLASDRTVRSSLLHINTTLVLNILLYEGYRYSSGFWQAFDNVSLAVSSLASFIIGYEVAVGPSYTGLWAVSLAAGLAVPFLLHMRPGRWRSALAVLAYWAALLLLAAVHTAFAPLLEQGLKWLAQSIITVHPFYAGESGQPLQWKPGLAWSFCAPILVLLLLPIWIGLQRLLPDPALPTSSDAVEGNDVRRRAVAGLGFCLIAVSMLGLVTRSIEAPPPGSKIVIIESEFAGMTKPQNNVFGLIRGGMFGGLGDLLGALDYEYLTVPPDNVAEILASEDISLVTVINPTVALPEEARSSIWQYVEQGGGLLVMGDHTDIFGIMAPLNELLEPVGVRFVFDSAYPIRTHWPDIMAFHPHPVTDGASMQRHVQMGTGASLTLVDSDARPVLVGRYAFGDYGNRLNEGQGGLLGDYTYQAGEQLGDLLLAVDSSYGDGRVIVFGDTTSFQVLAVPYAYDFVARLFAYLASPSPTGSWLTPLSWMGMLCGVCLSVWALRWYALPIATIALLLGDSAFDITRQPTEASFTKEAEIFVIDTSLVPRIPHAFFVEGSVGGIFSMAYRAGFLPLAAATWDTRRGVVPGGVAIIAPTETLNAAKRKWLQDYLDQGGFLFVAAGGPQLDAANDVLAMCGLRLAAVPLGPARSREADWQFDFYDSWSLKPLDAGSSDSEARRVFAKWRGHDIAVERDVGQHGGRCLAVGDFRFLGRPAVRRRVRLSSAQRAHVNPAVY